MFGTLIFGYKANKNSATLSKLQNIPISIVDFSLSRQ